MLNSSSEPPSEIKCYKCGNLGSITDGFYERMTKPVRPAYIEVVCERCDAVQRKSPFAQL